MTTKDQLTARKRGKGGTIVRLKEQVSSKGRPVWPALERETYVVKDLFDRKSYNVPGEIGVGPVDMGLAFGVTLDNVEIVDA